MRDTKGFENCTSRFGSAHAAGFHAVFVDGSVHFINYNIELNTYSYLGSRRDGEAMDLGQL